MQDCVIQKQTIPREMLGQLESCGTGIEDGEKLRDGLIRDGYVLLRGVLNANEVLAARGEVFARLEEVGEINAPAINGIASGHSKRRELAGDLKRFWKSVSEGPALRHVTHGSRLREIMAVVLDEEARAHDMMYVRPAVVGYSTRMHYDYPFFAGDSKRIHTAWVPLGDVPMTDGPLVIVEGSNRFDDLISPIRDHDYAQDRSNQAVQKAAYESQNTDEPITFLSERNARFLSTDFRAGDLVVFCGFLMHGSLENQSSLGQVRLSVDVRYQPAADPASDERYFGPDPKGSGGDSYGGMRGAKPLGEE